MTFTTESVHMLIVEDSGLDAEVACRVLHATPYCNCVIEHVCSLADLQRRVSTSPTDVILLDSDLSGGIDPDTLIDVISDLDVPVIVLSSNDDPSVAEESLACGAHDYILKSHSPQHILQRAIQFATRRRNRLDTPATTEAPSFRQPAPAQQTQARSPAEFRNPGMLSALIDHQGPCLAMVTADLQVAWADEVFQRLAGCRDGLPDGTRLTDCFPHAADQGWLNSVCNAVAQATDCQLSWCAAGPDTRYRWWRVEVFPVAATADRAQQFVVSLIPAKTSQINAVPFDTPDVGESSDWWEEIHA